MLASHTRCRILLVQLLLHAGMCVLYCYSIALHNNSYTYGTLTYAAGGGSCAGCPVLRLFGYGSSACFLWGRGYLLFIAAKCSRIQVRFMCRALFYMLWHEQLSCVGCCYVSLALQACLYTMRFVCQHVAAASDCAVECWPPANRLQRVITLRTVLWCHPQNEQIYSTIYVSNDHMVLLSPITNDVCALSKNISTTSAKYIRLCQNITYAQCQWKKLHKSGANQAIGLNNRKRQLH
jgi:hypothetical protein